MKGNIWLYVWQILRNFKKTMCGDCEIIGSGLWNVSSVTCVNEDFWYFTKPFQRYKNGCCFQNPFSWKIWRLVLLQFECTWYFWYWWLDSAWQLFYLINFLASLFKNACGSIFSMSFLVVMTNCSSNDT